MMSNKYKRVLVFAILYTVLFVVDGVKLLASLIPSAIANYLKYLVYVVLALYGSFLFKDRLIQQWNEIRYSKRKFFFGVLTGCLFLILVTVFFGFISGILRQFLGLDGQGLNQSNIQSTFQEQPLLLAVFACVIGFPSAFIASLAQTVARIIKHYSGRTCFCSDSYAQFGSIRVGQCSRLSRWRHCLFYYLYERKRECLLSSSCSHVKQ